MNPTPHYAKLRRELAAAIAQINPETHQPQERPWRDMPVGPQLGTVPAAIAALFAKLGVNVRYVNGEGANYDQKLDRLTLPDPAAFESPEAFTSIALHELIHWTRAPARLNRWQTTNHVRYDAEELVAELGALYLADALGLQGYSMELHAEYVLGYQIDIARRTGTAGAKLMPHVEAEARKAVDWILARN